MRNTILIASIAGLSFVSVSYLAVPYLAQPESSTSNSHSDNRLYAVDGEEKYPLTFLYAVDIETGEVLTYSPVIGQIRGEGALVQSTFTIGPDATATGIQSPCNRVQAADDAKELPFLTWTDMQDQSQHQFFTGKEVVFITEQPLIVGADNYLIVIPTAQ